MNLFRIKGDAVQDLEDGQNRERPVMIRRQNQRNGERREDGQVQLFASQGDQRHCPRVPKTDCCRDFVILDKQEQATDASDFELITWLVIKE